MVFFVVTVIILIEIFPNENKEQYLWEGRLLVRPPEQQRPPCPPPGSAPSSPGTLHPGGCPHPAAAMAAAAAAAVAGLGLCIAPAADGQHCEGKNPDLGVKSSHFYSDSLLLSRGVTLGLGCSGPQFPAKCRACRWPLMSFAQSGCESPTCSQRLHHSCVGVLAVAQGEHNLGSHPPKSTF